MLKVGITGGIGSGKTVVCEVFRLLGVPVFYADDSAKMLMETDADLVANITTLFGENIYASGKLDRETLARLVFGEAEKLSALNALVHPVTIRYAAEWMERQQAPYAIKEAAIFFETGSDKAMDIMIGVSAPAETRVRRAMQRTNASRIAIEARMAKQMDNDEKMCRCEFVILNDGAQAIIPQVLTLHEVLLKRANKDAFSTAGI